MDYDPAQAMSRGGSMRRSINRSVSRASRNLEDIFSSSSRRTKSVNEDEEALKWAAIEKLPTYSRLRTSLMPALGEDDIYSNQILNKEVDVTKLDGDDRQKFIDMVFKVAEQDNERILTKLRNRINRVGIKLPTVEVKYEHLTVKADCYTGDRSLPSLLNSVRNMGESVLGMVGIQFAKKAQLTILKDVSGIIKPSRMTLLLGPPSSGKTTLLLALAGKLDKSLDISGDVTYNGYRLNEFVPIKTSAYISQNDLHVGIMTVKETLDFSARCQGIGTRYDLLNELARREKDAGIFPEADVDLFMKASAAQGVKSSIITDYTLKILGLDICKDTIVGDDMMRGISGGQKKRVTTGEMIVGPTKTLFMDEISTGLDSSTTFQIVKCLQQIVHLNEATVVISLLQPAPETFDLFDDIILLSEGQIVYQGPRDHILEFFESFGFKCPERKGTADFLQEVTSKKDQEQYWVDERRPYRYIPVHEFATKFKNFHVGTKLSHELSVPFEKSKGHKAALVFDKYSVKKIELLKSCWDKEWMLMKRNSFFYVFKTVQIIIIAAITSTVFLRTEMNTRNESDANMYVSALLFGMIVNMFNGLAEMAMTIQRLPVFYKQRDLLFHPPWTYTLPTFLLGIPISIFETTAWMGVTYYSIGFAPEADRFFKQFLVVFLIQQMAAGIFRLIASICRTMTIANTGGMLVLLVVFLTGGFLLPRREIPVWWRWAFWASPLSYAFSAISNTELLAPRWMNKMSSDNTTRLGTAVLNIWDVFDDKNWYWVGVGALLAFAVLFNCLFTLALTYLDALGKPQAILPKEEDHDGSKSKYYFEIPMENMNTKKGMVLPFTPLALSFDDVKYFVDMPA
ncbi:BnaA08g31540D, partial [Brassica napus]